MDRINRLLQKKFNATAIQTYEPMLKTIWDAQNDICPISGIVIIPGKTGSLDHIVPVSRGGDNSKGNLRFVHKAINQMKGDFTDEELKSFLQEALPNIAKWASES